MATIDDHEDIEDRFPSPFVGRQMTLAEFQSLPRQRPPLELVDGIVRQRPLLTPTQSAVRLELASALDRVGRAFHHGLAFGGVDMTVGDLLFVPAVSYYRRDTLRSRNITSFSEDWGAPDIAAEIVPSNQRRSTQIERCRRYLDLGVCIALVIDVRAEQVVVLRPNEQPASSKVTSTSIWTSRHPDSSSPCGRCSIPRCRNGSSGRANAFPPPGPRPGPKLLPEARWSSGRRGSSPRAP